MVKKGRPKDPNLTIRKMQSFRMDLELYMRCQAACHHLGPEWVFTTEMEKMMSQWLREVQREHNNGKPFDVPDTKKFRAMKETLEREQRERQGAGTPTGG